MASPMMPAFRKLCAKGQLRLLREYPRLLPTLLNWGLDCQDALALAYNATLLYHVVEADPPFEKADQVLERYTLDEIAGLCEAYRQVAAGQLEYGWKEVES